MVNEVFSSAPLLISDYYDRLINQVDLLTEQQLKRYDRDERTVKNDLEDASSTNAHVRISEYLSMRRARDLEEIRRVREATLEHYETHKATFDGLVRAAQRGDERAVEALKRALFAVKFCFLVREERSFDDDDDDDTGDRFTLEFNQPYVIDFYFNTRNVVAL